eukprot:365490-Chlamydomonas_euryale.AAC.20
MGCTFMQKECHEQRSVRTSWLCTQSMTYQHHAKTYPGTKQLAYQGNCHWKMCCLVKLPACLYSSGRGSAAGGLTNGQRTIATRVAQYGPYPPPHTHTCPDRVDVRYGTAAGRVPRERQGQHGWHELRCYAHGRLSGTLLSL